MPELTPPKEKLGSILHAAILAGHSIILTNENFQAKVTLFNKKTNRKIDQYLPIDHHLCADKLAGCIEFCVQKTS